MPSPPVKRGKPEKEAPVEIEAMGAKEKGKADKAAKEMSRERESETESHDTGC